MRVLKPENVSLITRTIEIKRQSYFVITAMLGFSLDDPAVIWAETSLWSAIMEHAGGKNIIGGIFRPVAEVLLSGSCYAPQDKPVKVHQVRLVFGQVDKNLFVFGDREWQKGSIGFTATDPVPFTKMPIGFEHSFGGPNYLKNPLGRGHDWLVDETGRKYLPLPNVEDPNHLITSPSDRPDPAGLGPIHPTWPQRAAKHGTFNNDWLNNFWPSYPEDFDWYFFNKTPKDQWLKGWPSGNESFTLEGVHPDGPITSQLPGKKIRVFITRGPAGREEFSEVALNIDTIWFFPDQNLGMLCFRGIAPVQDDEASEVEYLYAAMEDLDHPNIIPIHYNEFKERLSPTKLEEEPVTPSPEPGAEVTPSIEEMAPVLSAEEKQLIQEMETKLVAAEKKLAQEMEKLGLNYEDIAQKASEAPPPGPLPSLEEAEALFARALKDAGLEKLPEAPAADPVASFNFDPKALIAAFKEGGLLTPELEQEIRRLDQEIQALPEGAFKMAPLDKGEKNSDVIPHSALTRDDLAAQYAQGRRDFSDLDLSGLDLSKMEWTGADFSRANLNQTDFTESLLIKAVFQETTVQKAIFTKARMVEADLTRADFFQADLREADLTGARAEEVNLAQTKASHAIFKSSNLARSVLTMIDLSEADLSMTNLSWAVASQARLTGASLVKAKLDKADFSEVDLSEADLSDVEAIQPDFHGANFSGANLVRARLHNANLDKATLTQADFSQVQAPSLSLHGAKGGKVAFRSAQLENLRADADTTLIYADFSEAQLPWSYFGGTQLSRAVFSQARLTGATFQNCNLVEANFNLAGANEVRFLKCDLTDAALVKADLLFASLAKSKCIRTDFRGSNMFGVDTLKTEFVEVKVFNANLKRTRITGRVINEP